MTAPSDTAETQDLTTPRPWKALAMWTLESGRPAWSIADGGPNFFVAAYEGNSEAEEDFVESLAQQIVREHNSHDALVEACEAALDWFDETTIACQPGCDCTHDMLREALRLARGGAS